MGENWRSSRKTTWPPASRTWLVSHVTRARPISYDSLDHSRAFLFSIRKKKNGKSEAKNLCVEVHWGGGGGREGGTPTITDFYFLDLEFSEFRVDSSKQNTEPLPISWILWLIFIRFQDSRKIQCQSHDHMKFLMCYLLSGLNKTARNSQNAIKESPPKASQTQKIFSVGGLRPPPQNPPSGLCPGPTRVPPWPLAQFDPPPQHTKVWIRPWHEHSPPPFWETIHFTLEASWAQL